jgi:hypothetical protein
VEHDRTPCCLVAGSVCGTRFEALRRWACGRTGKAVRLVRLDGDEQGQAPFFAQPVGFDGRAFFVAADGGCDTEKLLHEVCHWRDNEEVTVMLLERLLAPQFHLAEERIARPDYNVANRRNVDWEVCDARARAIHASARPDGE